jgi:hypothetical protein
MGIFKKVEEILFTGKIIFKNNKDIFHINKEIIHIFEV